MSVGRVLLGVAVGVVVPVGVAMTGAGLDHLDMRGRDAGSEHGADAQFVSHAQAAERVAKGIGGQTGVEQRAEQHVAGGA
jgi:hypothetical protein